MANETRPFTVYTLTVSNQPKAKPRTVVCFGREQLDRAVDRYAADRLCSGLAVLRHIKAEGRA